MRLRFRFTKLGKIRYTSHRDLARMYERALRRTQLPVAYSGGFSPRPKLSFGLALSTGHESLAEYLDIVLESPLHDEALAALPAELSAALPVGVDVVRAVAVGVGEPSLQEDVASCTFRLDVADLEPAHAEHLVATALAADELVLTRTRKGKEIVDDLRPAVLAVSVVGPTDRGTELEAELAVHPRSARPAELLRALSPDRALEARRVLRTAQWIWRDGARVEPLTAAAAPDATAPPHAEAHGASRREHPDGRPRTTGGLVPPAEQPGREGPAPLRVVAGSG
jgi:radical SAM-linked protein